MYILLTTKTQSFSVKVPDGAESHVFSLVKRYLKRLAPEPPYGIWRKLMTKEEPK